MGRGENLELIKYMIEVLLAGSENAMIAVAEELERFGEKGELWSSCFLARSDTTLFSAADVPCRGDGEINDAIRQHHDDRDILF